MTECPYCGTRLRKRAPKLERHGDELTAREGPAGSGGGAGLRSASPRRKATVYDVERPWVSTIAALATRRVVLIVERAFEPHVCWTWGAIVRPVGDEYWRFLGVPPSSMTTSATCS